MILVEVSILSLVHAFSTFTALKLGERSMMQEDSLVASRVTYAPFSSGIKSPKVSL